MWWREIEEPKIPHNPLDVLAQQIVAMTAVDDWLVDDLEHLVRRAAPFSGLTRPLLEAVLDMLAGRYPSEEFAGLRPRLVWDRVAGAIRARPGAQRLAVTSGGTIPDRGLFGVFLARIPSQAAAPGRRARRGDGVRVAGRRRVRARRQLVADRGHHAGPGAGHARPGQAGKLPFWHGDTPGRPAELGQAIGRPAASWRWPGSRRRRGRLVQAGLDELAAQEPDQVPRRAARGHRLRARRPDPGGGALPRRARRLAGGAAQPVRGPRARAVGASHRGRLRERYGGMDVQALHTDDGIIIWVPDSTSRRRPGSP